MKNFKNNFNSILNLIYRTKSDDTEEIKKLKSDIYSNVYCLIGLIFTVIYVFLDYFFSDDKMVWIAIVCFLLMLLIMLLSIKRISKLIENNAPNLGRIKSNLENISSFSGLIAPIIFVVSILISFIP